MSKTGSVSLNVCECVCVDGKEMEGQKDWTFISSPKKKKTETARIKHNQHHFFSPFNFFALNYVPKITKTRINHPTVTMEKDAKSVAKLQNTVSPSERLRI